MKTMKITRRKLKASTLVEVLIAMVILLSVFAVGMMIFANLTSSSRSRESKTIQAQMQDILFQYRQDEDIPSTQTIDSVVYYLEEKPLTAYPDLTKVTVYAERLADHAVIDSVIEIQLRLPHLRTSGSQ